MKRNLRFLARFSIAGLIVWAAFFASGLSAAGQASQASQGSTASQGSQEGWFQTGTGLGITKARVAVPELAARPAAAPPLEKTFHDVLWADLDYCGVLDLVSPSFYPLQVPS